MRKLLAILFLFTVALVDAQELQISADTLVSNYNVTIDTTGNSWSITGNSGTNYVTNFIGTTDTQAFVLKANNGGYPVAVFTNSSFNVADSLNDVDKFIVDVENNQSEFKTSLRIKDGTEGTGKVFTSDSAGYGSWQYDTVGSGLYLPLAGGTMDSGSHIYFGIGLQNISQGTFDNSTGGNRGISLNCAVGYELNWQGGHLSSSYNNGTTFYPVVIDSGLSVSGTLYTTFSNNVGTSAIFNGDATTIGGTDSCFMLLGSGTGSRILIGQQGQRIVLSANDVKSKTQYFNVNDTTGNLGFEVDFDNNLINMQLPLNVAVPNGADTVKFVVGKFDLGAGLMDGAGFDITDYANGTGASMGVVNGSAFGIGNTAVVAQVSTNRHNASFAIDTFNMAMSFSSNDNDTVTSLGFNDTEFSIYRGITTQNINTQIVIDDFTSQIGATDSTNAFRSFEATNGGGTQAGRLQWNTPSYTFILPDTDGTANQVLATDGSGNGFWQGGIIYDSLTSLTGETVTLTNNSTYIIAASGTVVSVTWSFPTGNTGDVLDIENMQVITTLNITGTGTGTITAAKITNSKTAGLKTFHNYGGNWY